MNHSAYESDKANERKSRSKKNSKRKNQGFRNPKQIRAFMTIILNEETKCL